MKGAQKCCGSQKGPGNVANRERGSEMLWIVKGAPKKSMSRKMPKKYAGHQRGAQKPVNHGRGPQKGENEVKIEIV